MNIAVLGAGGMGRAAVYDLVRAKGVHDVIVIDRDRDRVEDVARTCGGRTIPMAFDLTDRRALLQALEGCDAVLGAASYRLNLLLSRVCIRAGAHFCDLGGNTDVVHAQFALSDEARAAGVAIIPDCGLAPGLVSVLTARALELLPDAASVRIRVGGLPQKPVPPWNYQVVFSPEGLINEYSQPTVALRDGEVVEVPTLGDLESLSFPPPFEQLEAFHTSGGASTLPWTLKGRVRDLDYKTIRYPGHRDLVAALFALGFADDGPVPVDGAPVRPRRVLERQIAEHLAGSGPDCVLLLVEARGPSGSVAFRLVDREDPDTGLTAMMRCTAFPAAVVAWLLASGAVQERGTLHQELVLPPGPFVAALRRRGLAIEMRRGR